MILLVSLKAASTLWGVSDFGEEDGKKGHDDGIDEDSTFTQQDQKATQPVNTTNLTAEKV